MAQRVETFTVAILDDITKKPVGTGFIVAENLIVTAYHVLLSALRLPNEAVLSHGTHVWIRFPVAQIDEIGIVTEYNSADADIALLRVDGIPSSCKIAVLGPSIGCAGHRFVSAGYRGISGGAVGTIAPPELESKRAPYLRLVLRSDQIDRGMSGAPVLDLDVDRVVGMVVSTWYGEPASGKDRETSFAIPAEAIRQVCGLVSLVEPLNEVGLAIVQTRGVILENLPARRARHFVGRGDEKQTILNLLKDEGATVVIFGTGGMGKTTLALEIAHCCMERRLVEAIIWVSTEFKSELTSSRLLDTISEVFGFKVYKRLDRENKMSRVWRLLRSRQSLLVIDGFEQVRDPELIGFIQTRPRQCRLLITTRYLTGVPQGEIIRLRELNKLESEELMRVLSSNKRLENAPSEVYHEVYSACGGMPLALEWAIGQINVGRQTLQMVVSSLTQAKIRALYETLFENSYDRLSDTEKQIIWAIVVSIGTISKRALRFMTELDEEIISETLKQLIDMSLVYENGEFDEEQVQFSVHPLLHNFMQAKLVQHPNVAERLTERYIRYFSDLAARNEYEYLKVDEVRFVLDWCSRHNQRKLIQLVYALSYFFFNYGLWEERIKWAREALNASRNLGDSKAEAWMLINELGYMSIQQGKYNLAEEYLRDGLRVVQERLSAMNTDEIVTDAEDKLGWQFMRGLAFRYLGILNSNCSNYSEAQGYFDESAKIFESLKRKSILANQAIEMAELALKRGDIDAALSLYRESITYYDEQRDEKPWVLPWMARAYYGLGDIQMQGGELDKARDLYMAALDLLRIRYDEYEIAQVSYRLALVDEKIGNYESAVRLLEDALRVFARLGTVAQFDQVEETITRIRSLQKEH